MQKKMFLKCIYLYFIIKLESQIYIENMNEAVGNVWPIENMWPEKAFCPVMPSQL